MQGWSKEIVRKRLYCKYILWRDQVPGFRLRRLVMQALPQVLDWFFLKLFLAILWYWIFETFMFLHCWMQILWRSCMIKCWNLWMLNEQCPQMLGCGHWLKIVKVMTTSNFCSTFCRIFEDLLVRNSFLIYFSQFIST